MKKSKRILSAITALAISASAFASMVIPASAEADPAGVIDFTNRTLTQTAKGNATNFIVEDAASTDSKLNAAGLKAAGAGNVLKLGSSASGGDKMLGYTAPLLVNSGNVTEYSGEVTLSFKLEPIQVRTDKDASMVVQFSDISKANPIFPIVVHVGNTAKFEVNGQTVNTEYGKYYVVEETLNFDKKEGSVTVKGSDGTVLLNASKATLTASNLAYLYYPNTAWNYGNCAIDDITLDATTIGTPVYYTAVVNTTRYAKMVTSDNKTYYADVNGKLTIPLIKPNTTFTYTLSKEGYTSVEGEIEVTDADVTQSKPLTLADESTLFIESEFGNENEAYVSAGRMRNDSISIGEFALPEMSQISVDFNFAGFGSYGGQQKTWDIETDGGKLVGIQITDDGLFAWTGWTGTANMNQSDDIAKYTNSVRLGDAPSGDFSIDFVVGTAGKGITVLYNNTANSLTYTINATKLTGMATGLYRYNGQLSTKKITVTTPDADFMSIVGSSGFAKVSGQTVSRSYSILQTVVVSGETFTWTVSRSDDKATTGITVADGVLSVADTAEPGTITLTCQGSSSDDKNASMDITIGDFQQMTTFEIDGPHAYDVTDEDGGIYMVTKAIDSFGDDVLALLPAPVWKSSNEEVATINSSTGVLTVVGAGSTDVTATITNGTATITATIPVTVGTYYVTADADGDTTNVDLTGIVSDGVAGYLVTTADADGKQVAQTTLDVDDIKNATESKLTCPQAAVKVTATYTAGGQLTSVTTSNVAMDSVITEIGDVSVEGASTKKFVYYWDDIDTMEPVVPTLTEVPVVGGEVEVDTTGAAKVEVAPIFETTLNAALSVPADRYNVTATVSDGRRSDLYVNDQMLINNLNQGSDNWNIVDGETIIGGGRTIAESTDYEAHDIVINQGYANFNLRDDQSGGTLVTKVKFAKAPSIVNRAKRVYAIGDSLVAKYYGTPAEGYEAQVRTGWGDVLQNYIKDAEVTNLGNSGAWATGMLSDAFTNVAESAQAGDVLILESGYNDKSHSTVAAMTEAVTEMVHRACDLGMTVFVVTPNASVHDFKADVAWATQIKTICNDINTADDDYEVNVIDLSAESYKYLATHYGLDLADGSATRKLLLTYYNNTGDTLHSTANAANVWAAVVATGVSDVLPDIVNTEYEYTLNDGTGEIAISAGMDFAGDYQFSITAPEGYAVTDEDGETITTAAYGDTVTVTLPAGVDADEVLINDGKVTFEKGDGNITFDMPIGDVTVAVKTYSVTLATGSASLIKRVDAEGAASAAIVAAHGETVYFKAADGVTLETVTIAYTPEGGSETEETLTPSEGIYSFTMPKAAVTVTAAASDPGDGGAEL